MCFCLIRKASMSCLKYFLLFLERVGRFKVEMSSLLIKVRLGDYLVVLK